MGDLLLAGLTFLFHDHPLGTGIALGYALGIFSSKAFVRWIQEELRLLWRHRRWLFCRDRDTLYDRSKNRYCRRCADERYRMIVIAPVDDHCPECGTHFPVIAPEEERRQY